MKVILFMAMSLNGMIVDKDGKEDFLDEKNWETFLELARKTGNCVIGRTTFEAVEGWGADYSFSKLGGVKPVILTKHRNSDIATASSPKEAIDLLDEAGFSEVLLTGGARTNTSFAEQGLIDEVIINIEPALIGDGVSIFLTGNFSINLQLIGSKETGNGILQLHYKVVK